MFQRATEVWPEGESLLHVYIVVDLEHAPELAALVRGVREATEGVPLAYIEGKWLHINIDQITDRPGSQIPASERAALAKALTAELADTAPFEITIGSVLTYITGLIADCHPDEALYALHRAVRKVIRAVRGELAARYPWSPPHLSLAYATGHDDSDQVQRRVRRVRPGHARLLIKEVELVECFADLQAGTITWERIERIPLAGR